MKTPILIRDILDAIATSTDRAALRAVSRAAADRFNELNAIDIRAYRIGQKVLVRMRRNDPDPRPGTILRIGPKNAVVEVVVADGFLRAYRVPACNLQPAEA